MRARAPLRPTPGGVALLVLGVSAALWGGFALLADVAAGLDVLAAL